MGDSDDENYVSFGVPLEPIDEDNVPRKKPMSIENQCVYDEQGRRRFHGAFTGGFSAGYYNTVGTQDGWRPQQFKSSRSSKAENIAQRPEDFMDDEDTSQFGIAPKGIRATSDYADHGQRGVKRERMNRESSGPIPGTPLLKALLKPVKETVGITLLKQMGWRPGQGVGSRLTKKEKAKIRRRNDKIKTLQQQSRKPTSESSSEDSEDDYKDITFAPDDYEPFRCNPKGNFFGIGYSGLDRRTVLSGHIDLFDAPAFSIREKNKKLSIHGQAFGVGAFEADDEDIYETEDMSRYDFALGPEAKKKTRWSDDTRHRHTNDCLDGFAPAKNRLESKKVFAPPELPKDFIPMHAVRKSRFYPPIENVPRTVENGRRKDLTAADRARILEDTASIKKVSDTHPNAVPSVASNIITKTLNLHGKQQTEERQKLESQQAKGATSWMDKLNLQSFIKGGVVGFSKESEGSLKKLEEFKDSPSTSKECQIITDSSKSEEDDSTKKSTAKPFLSDPDKQRRFEQYLALSKKSEQSKLESIQPLSMTEWDREHERTEFEQAARLFDQPTSDYVASKFTVASDSVTSDGDSEKGSQEDEMKQAVKMKMFGKLTRERIEWKPASIVCKRFNIPEPRVGCAQPELQKKTVKFSIFDSLNWSNSTKFSRATDTVSRESDIVDSRSKDRSVVTSANSEVKSDNGVPLDDRQALEPVSEKIRNFEATYEKVFGKEVQEASSRIPEVEPILPSTIDLTAPSETVDKVEKVKEDENASRSEPKSKSEEKKDLFKAIFLSSSEESDSEPEESMDSEAVKSVLIGKAPSELNVNRNTSPPRGIFAKVDLDSLLASSKSSAQANENVNKEKDIVNLATNPEPGTGSNQSNDGSSNPVEPAMLPDMYGPVLPSRLLKSDNSASEASSSQTLKPVFKSVVVPKPKTDSKVSGVWVEREKVKKSKKEKKKHKHKEHKSSKHKRKSKKNKRDS
ncbi:G patch domain-containing protein 1 homolog [Hylaeus volcanicus]|uniref:G patch domain-containing protein 1 homolog n=1 Tax=Hylaeus volcanicus TaxID=313075 RepID=UPI0023B7C849|nr:G patch domain-containing protein 1 homolog [Hylaeus volcanicus]XP_053972209.1 G patch domain-containing protein 1 homolog [Hylaeus volcanicus]XP_053972210.1 G patch domain-containing protein 1 homolog [Hylaeus volcanicus]